MSDGFTFRSRAQARQYFTAVNDQARLAAVDTEYSHLPERHSSLPEPKRYLDTLPDFAAHKARLAELRPTKPYEPKP